MKKGPDHGRHVITPEIATTSGACFTAAHLGPFERLDGDALEDSPIDLFMLRYNAAHPGAEQDVFPQLARRAPAVVAYTATSWRKLLRLPQGWRGPPMTAGECYRFCLSSPHVDVVLTAPASRAELQQNLDALARGPLDEGRLAEVREFGRVVHG